MDYKKTLNLPQTDFPMKASLTEQEPRRVEKWNKGNLYKKLQKARAGAKKYILHDGPPYANGDIHIGTGLNKILKDIIVKIKNGSGFDSPYVPGWDCHGLPIEHKVDKELGPKKATMTKSEIRKLCREYANHWIDVQRNSFKRLGVIGDWDHPYITMDHMYESVTLREFYRVFNTGGIYKGYKPVYWCSTCVTALAEAEVEYGDHKSHSIFVKFPITEASLAKLGIKEPVSAVIWTTTPWTLPSNMGISAHPSEIYSVMRVDEATSANLKQGELLLVAQPLTKDDAGETPLREKMGIVRWTEVKSMPGKDLDRLIARHPFYDRDSLLMVGEHVLMTDGTGLVHTAPAHGQEDYVIGNLYGLEVFNPVDDYGKYKADLPLFGGMDINTANKEILNLMQENGSLIASSMFSHSYPHCWRCKKPVIYRATPQWFISMEHNNLRQKALNAIEHEVKWIPAWGANRIHSMVENRPDWCISRQRTWGVPIAMFTCRSCDNIIMDQEIEDRVVKSFEEHGADAWFDFDNDYFLGKDAVCPHCGSKDIKKESDILDVWFDSGTSHAAVCEVRPELGKADMYLEGTDQHRGWFHSSLLESIATRGKAPFREVLTHGFLVDADLRKMSKSLGNVVTAEELVKAHGAEIIRLWVAGEDYTEDIRLSKDIIKRVEESYRKIRNTGRYLLGNLYDFNPDTDMLPFDELMDLDKYILLRWQDTLKKIYAGYDAYQFHMFYHTFINFCINDLSAFYLDIIKDRVYSYGAASKMRRSAQSAMFTLIKEMAVVMAPVLSFTSDEVWDYLPAWNGKEEFVFEETFPPADRFSDDALRAKFDLLLEVRKTANKALETARADKVIGHPLDAKIFIGMKSGVDSLLSINEGLTRLLIVSEAEVLPFDKVPDGSINEEGTIIVKAQLSDAQKCDRCWTRSRDVGEKTEGLCNRCADVLNEGAID